MVTIWTYIFTTFTCRLLLPRSWVPGHLGAWDAGGSENRNLRAVICNTKSCIAIHWTYRSHTEYTCIPLFAYHLIWGLVAWQRSELYMYMTSQCFFHHHPKFVSFFSLLMTLSLLYITFCQCCIWLVVTVLDFRCWMWFLARKYPESGLRMALMWHHDDL